MHLQHMEDKFSERTGFRFKTPPLETKRMRVHIDKYLEVAKDKFTQAVAKLANTAKEWEAELARG